MAGSGYILLYCIYILNVHSCHFNKDISINQSIQETFSSVSYSGLNYYNIMHNIYIFDYLNTHI